MEIAIQIQTPPKDDEVESQPGPHEPTESFEAVENPEKDEEGGETDEDPRADEIVVGDDEELEELEEHNGDYDHETSLSSPPGSVAGPETSKEGIHPSYLNMEF